VTSLLYATYREHVAHIGDDSEALDRFASHALGGLFYAIEQQHKATLTLDALDALKRAYEFARPRAVAS
jgi:hypothetical protein